MAIDDEDLVKFTIRLPKWYARRLELWAHLKATNRATLMANIGQARLEANKEVIDDLLDQAAASKGITREELEQQILGDPEP